MSPIVTFPDLEAAREEAATWIARAFRGLTPEETATLRDWSRLPVNRRAMTEMSDIWQGLDVLSVLADLFPRDGSIVPAAPAQPVMPRGAPRTFRLALAAGVLLAAVGIATIVGLRSRSTAPDAMSEPALQAVAYSSTVGEHRSIRLRDGSELALNSDTLVEVAFSPGLRSLTLHRGEAHFDVAHDASRPFLVHVNSRVVRAVGTAFNIRRRDGEQLDVLVTTGAVSTYAADRATAADVATVTAGQLLRFGAEGARVRTLGAAEMDSLTAWRRGVLILDGITLEAALLEVARYTTKQIHIDDPRLRTLRLGGSFPTGDLDAVLRSLTANFGIDVSEDAEGELHLRARPVT